MYTLRVFRGRCRLLSMDCGNFHKWILTHRDGYRPYTESNLHVTRYRRDVWEGCGCVYTFVCLIMLLVRLSFSLYRAYTIYLKTKSHRNFNSVEIRYEARVTGRGDLRSKVKDPRNWERKRKKIVFCTYLCENRPIYTKPRLRQKETTYRSLTYIQLQSTRTRSAYSDFYRRYRIDLTYLHRVREKTAP